MPVLAAVDIGANSVRLSIARFAGRRRTVIHEDREVTRLGASVFASGLLEPAAMAQTVKVLRRFRRATQTFGTSAVRVVATSALRDARNAAVLEEWIRAATGWRVEVISGLEEGSLIHLGVVTQARLRARRVLLVDLGGGSCECTVSVDRHIRQMASLPLGAVRLTQEFLRRDPPKKKELERLRGYIAAEIERVAPELRAARVQMTLATSGTAAALAELQRARTHQRGLAVPAAALRRLYKLLARSSAEQRARLPGMGPRRAEIIVAGAAVYLELVERVGLRGLHYSPLGLRDGILAQMAAERHPGSQRRIEAERWEAARAAARHYGVDMAHAERVRALAAQLFRRLRPLHRLPPAYAEWLELAALLCESGNYISRSQSRRHAYYLIANADLFGYSPSQRRLAAAIARFQGRLLPTASHTVVRNLPVDEQAALPKAVLLLRLARALDKGRQGAVAGLRLSLRPSQVHLRLQMRSGDGELETWALEKECQAFREVFGRELVAVASARRRPTRASRAVSR